MTGQIENLVENERERGNNRPTRGKRACHPRQ